MSTSTTRSVAAATASAVPARYVELAGRVLLASLYLLSGLSKITGYAATAAYMTSMGVSAALLPLVIATEVLGSLAIILGWHTRIAAFLLAGFTLLAAGLFHNHLADQIQMIMFLKDVAITGAWLMLMVNGAGALSLDHRRAR